MKTVVLLAVSFFFMVSLGFSAQKFNYKEENINAEKVGFSKDCSHNQMLPWADFEYVDMELVSQRNEYTLWRCKSLLVKNYPGKHIHGKNFHYFVYKNKQFHLTVTEMNKSCVFSFFTQQI